MASSYASPSIPTAPTTTPVSVRARLRAPIHNPYDKFTGNDFNAWIGDLTSKIRRVLAHEEPVVEQVSSSGDAGDVSAYDDGPMEDSFAEVKARRALKGKGRADPDEVTDEEVVESIVASDDLEEHELQEEYEYDEEDYSDEEVSTQKGLPETIELSSDEDDEPSAHRPSSPGIEDEEGESDEEEDSHRESFDIVDDDDELQPEDDDPEDDFPPRTQQYIPPSVNIADPWAGPSTFAEDFYSGGDLPQSALPIGDPHVLPTEELDLSEEQFPPATTLGQPAELADPWTGPRTYAEDFYSGGDVLGESSALTPSHLTPMPTTPRDDDDVGMVLTPGVVSPTPSVESPRSVYDIDELEDESPQMQTSQIHAREQSEEAVDEEVPTFSMPITKEAEEADTDHPTSIHEEASGSKGKEDSIEPSQPVPLHGRSVSPSPIAASRHVDWNYPPAFPGRVASSAGHLNISPDEYVAPVPEAQTGRAHSPEVFEISDDEEPTTEPRKSDSFRPDDLSLEEVTAPTVGDEGPERNIPGEAAIGISPTTSTAKEAGDYDFDTFESLYLATDFHELDEDPSAEDTGLDELFEPICAQSSDFGDLPINTPPGERGRDAFSPELLSIFEQFHKPDGPTEGMDISKLQKDDTDTAATLRPLEASNVEKVAPLAVADDQAPEATNTKRQTDHNRLEDVDRHKNDDDDSHQYQREILEIHEDEKMSDGASQAAPYEVLEMDVSVEAAADRETTVDLDVMTDIGDGSVFGIDYVVEETMTEGRRTLEPEESKGGNAADSPVTQPEHAEEVDHVEMAILPPTPPDAASPSGVDGNEGLVPERLEEEHLQANDIHTEDPLSLTTDLSSGSPPSHEHDSTFAGGIPMPVSADPTVPDPASMHSTPLSPQSPVETMEDNAVNEGASSGGERDRQRAAASAIPPSLLKHLSGHKSISGLFTPLTETDSSPSGSVRSSEQSEDEAAQGQPLGDGANAPVDDAPIDDAPDVVVAEDINVPATTVPEAVDHPAADATSEVPASTSTPAIEALPEVLDASTDAGEQGENDEDEADADGDVDSDYDIRSSRERSLPPQTEEIQEYTTAEDSLPEDSQEPIETVEPVANEELQPIVLDDTVLETSQTAPPTSGDVLSPTDIPGLGSMEDKSIPQLSLPPAIETEPTDDARVADQAKSGDVDEGADTTEVPAVAEPLELAAELSEPQVEPESSESSSPKSITAFEAPRPLKRKRREPTPVPQRMTRSMSTKGLPAAPDPPAKPASKGKGKAKADDSPAADDDDDDAASVALSSLSEAAPSNLETISEYPGSSRSGSVETTDPPYTADSSPLTAYPPPSARQNMQAVFGLIHAHGLLHHHHGRALPQLQAPTRIPARESPPERAVSPAPALEAAKEPTSTEEPASPVTQSTTSPVTRSNCRFHKISLPKEEGGPRVFFVVPGCSLSDKELMEDEEIQDHGPAQTEDQAWLIPDIESLDLSSYLLGVLRQLVGVDLLREQEIFYLAQPGETPRFKGKRRVKHRVRESISGRNSFGPQLSKKSATARKRRPTGNTDSISASGSMARRRSQRSASASVSISDNEMEGEEPKPKAKRRKDNTADASVSASTPEADSSRPTAPPRTRRGKRLGTDAAEYKPNPLANEESEAESEATASRKRRATRSRKRPRGDDATQNEPAPEAAAKKRKITGADGGDPEDRVSSQPQSE